MADVVAESLAQARIDGQQLGFQRIDPVGAVAVGRREHTPGVEPVERVAALAQPCRLAQQGIPFELHKPADVGSASHDAQPFRRNERSLTPGPVRPA